MDKLQRGKKNLQFSSKLRCTAVKFPRWHPPSQPASESSAKHTRSQKKKEKKKHPHKHTPCIVFSYAQLLMDKQRAVNCDGLSADIFPPHISEAREKRTQELAL